MPHLTTSPIRWWQPQENTIRYFQTNNYIMKKNTHLTLGIFGLLFSICSSTYSQNNNYYSYHPMQVLHLGQGFFPDNLTRPTRTAINFDIDTTASGSISTQLSYLLVTNSEQLKKSLNIDFSVDAQILDMVDVNVKYNYEKSTELSESSLVCVISANTEFGKLVLKNDKLSKDAQDLAATDNDKFINSYGSNIVLEERRGASASIILTLTNIDKKTKEAILTSASAKIDLGAVEASVNINFKNELQRAIKQGRITFDVLSTGGASIDKLSSTVRILLSATNDNFQLGSLGESIEEYLKEFNLKNSAPIGYFTAPMDVYGIKTSNESLSKQKIRELSSIKDRYKYTKFSYNALKSIIEPNSLYLSRLQNTKTANDIENAIPKFEKYLDILEKLHFNHLNNKTGDSLIIPNAPIEVSYFTINKSNIYSCGKNYNDPKTIVLKPELFTVKIKGILIEKAILYVDDKDFEQVFPLNIYPNQITDCYDIQLLLSLTKIKEYAINRNPLSTNDNLSLKIYIKDIWGNESTSKLFLITKENKTELTFLPESETFKNSKNCNCN